MTLRLLTSTFSASPLHNSPQEASVSASVEPEAREGNLGPCAAPGMEMVTFTTPTVQTQGVLQLACDSLQ